MPQYLLETLPTLQQHLARDYQVYQPIIANQQGDTHWQAIKDGEPVTLNQRLPISSPKTLLFSERENLFNFDGEMFRETIPTPAPFVLLGIQSCDLTAIAYQDKFFANDPYYQARRQQALLIGMDCLSPCEFGFCHSVDAGPGVSTDCADIILHRQNKGHYLMLVCSDKGEQALAGLALKPADSNALNHREDQLNHCLQQFDDRPYIDKGIDIVCHQEVDDSFWQQAGVQCLSCSGCSNLCPTCSCYGTRDLAEDQGNIVQQRFWDSCLYEGFQREASQHNPSQQAGTRLRRFWTHKFSQQTLEHFSRHGCVGCGRCEQTCPGVIGVHSIMKRVVTHQKANELC